jgi:hypothetical protein
MAQALPVIFAMQAATTVGETYSQIQASKAQDRYQRTMADIDARNREIAAEEAMAAGEGRAVRIRGEAARMTGAQRAAFAGQGVDVGTGAPAAVRAETEFFGELDAIQETSNAWREAFGYRTEAQMIRRESKIRSQEARFQRRMTLATGGMRAATSLAQAGYAHGQNRPPAASGGGSGLPTSLSHQGYVQRVRR